jgi:hypothetical protein
MAQSVWPRDTAAELDPPLKPLGELACFVISPFQPQIRFDDLFELVKGVCLEIKNALQLDGFSCMRSDTITSAGVIHPEIWQKIKQADVLVVDVSGQNGNVMLELGVAAAWHNKEQVIILREENPEEKHLFDINPARHIEYTRTASGFETLKNKLRETMFAAIAAAPFEDIPTESPRFPSVANLDNGQDCADLWVPSTSHRRMLGDCLEFGSFDHFARSWLAIGNVKLRNVSVSAELRFTERRETQHKCWMGINLRSQLFWANMGHLVLLRSDGSVARTARKSEDPSTHYDIELGKLNDYNPESFVRFAITFDDQAWDIDVGSVKTRVPVQEIPFVFSAGRMLLQTYMCRVGVRKLEVRAL